MPELLRQHLRCLKLFRAVVAREIATGNWNFDAENVMNRQLMALTCELAASIDTPEALQAIHNWRVECEALCLPDSPRWGGVEVAHALRGLLRWYEAILDANGLPSAWN